MSSKRNNHNPLKRIVIDIAGFGLIVLGILASPIPGPGGVPIIALGLGVLSLNYEWADRFLKDFDNKRRETTEKYFNPRPPMSWILDIFAISFSFGGLWILLTQDSALLKGLGISWIFTGVVILCSNQKRIDRLMKKLKSR